MDPLHKLLKKDEDREAAVRALGDAHHALDEVVATYRSAFKAATGRVQLSVYPSFCLKGLMHDE